MRGDETVCMRESMHAKVDVFPLQGTDRRTRMDPYTRWITVHVHGNLRGRCAAWTRRMQQTFPELRRVGGIVAPADHPPYAGVHLVQQHWWLLTPAGQVVDPTARQFGWPLVYIEFGDEAALAALLKEDR